MNLSIFHRRRRPRKKRDVAAWIEKHSSAVLERCKLINVSDDGALLSIDDVYDMPNQFRLRLIRESPAVLNCKVIWQRDKQVGVQFLQSSNV
jgi:PilZ domain